MSFLDSLSLYTASQKVVAYGFIACGLALIFLSIFLFIYAHANHSLWHGLKIGGLVLGIAILLGGIGYHGFSDKVHAQVTAEYASNTESALSAEAQRMSKVVNDYGAYQIAFAVIVLLSLIAIIYAKPFWSGFGFAAAFLFLAVLLIEAHSKYSIDAHAELVGTLVPDDN